MMVTCSPPRLESRLGVMLTNAGGGKTYFMVNVTTDSSGMVDRVSRRVKTKSPVDALDGEDKVRIVLPTTEEKLGRIETGWGVSEVKAAKISAYQTVGKTGKSAATIVISVPPPISLVEGVSLIMDGRLKNVRDSDKVLVAAPPVELGRVTLTV